MDKCGATVVKKSPDRNLHHIMPPKGAFESFALFGPWKKTLDVMDVDVMIDVEQFFDWKN